jgi:anti-sigma-K factor RskA
VDEVDEERQRRMDERFARDKERLDRVEITNEDLKQLTARMGVILENQEKQIANHEKRLADMESKPARRWDIIVNSALQWLAVAVMAAVVVFK